MNRCCCGTAETVGKRANGGSEWKPANKADAGATAINRIRTAPSRASSVALPPSGRDSPESRGSPCVECALGGARLFGPTAQSLDWIHDQPIHSVQCERCGLSSHHQRDDRIELRDPVMDRAHRKVGDESDRRGGADIRSAKPLSPKRSCASYPSSSILNSRGGDASLAIWNDVIKDKDQGPTFGGMILIDLFRVIERFR